MPINESYHISSIRSLRKFTLANYRLLKLAWSRATKSGKKIETVAWTLYFNTWTLCICISARVGKSFAKCLLNRLVEKISLVIFDTDHAFKWQNTLFLTKKLFIKVSMMRRSHLVLFLQGKSLCFGMILVEKIISPVLFDTNRSFKR